MAKRTKTPEKALAEADDTIEVVLMDLDCNLAVFSALTRARAELAIALRGLEFPDDEDVGDEEEDEDEE